MCPRDYPYDRPDVCAGYLVSRMPQVLEAARASSWRKDGALREFYGDAELTELTKFAIDTIMGEMRAVEQHAIRESTKKV